MLYCIEAVVNCAERNLIQFKLCFLPVNCNHDSVFGSRAAMQMRMDRDERFLAEHCDNISDCSFSILHEPEEDNPFGFLEM